MITVTAFTVIVMNFCQWKNSNVQQEARIACTEFMNNCSFKGQNDGQQTSKEVVEACKTKWMGKVSRGQLWE